MERTYLFYIVFQVFKVFLIKICKMQPPDILVLFVFISFYISRYHFSQIWRTSFDNIWKKMLSSWIFLFKGFAQTSHRPTPPNPPTPPHPPYSLNGQNPLSVTKVFCRCSQYLSATSQIWSFDRYSLTYPIHSWCAIPLCHSPHFVLP